jgi:Ca-activated chloride channel family protein
VEQTVTSLSVEDEPVAVGLVFDVSGSMSDKLRLARLAASAFLQSANPDD